MGRSWHSLWGLGQVGLRAVTVGLGALVVAERRGECSQMFTLTMAFKKDRGLSSAFGEAYGVARSQATAIDGVKEQRPE